MSSISVSTAVATIRHHERQLDAGFDNDAAYTRSKAAMLAAVETLRALVPNRRERFAIMAD
jgi:hypothetical protein